jgi:hypothetical protein
VLLESLADSMKCNDSLRLNPFSAGLIILVAEERHFTYLKPLSLDFTAFLDLCKPYTVVNW